MKNVVGFILVATLCLDKVFAQWQMHSSEVAGNYSSVFLAKSARSGLRGGWDEVADTLNSKSSELLFLTTIMIPVAGDPTDSPTFALGLEIPHLTKTYVRDGGDEISQTGIGDLTVVGKYGFSIYEPASFGSGQSLFKAKVDLIGKIKFPTGRRMQAGSSGETVLSHDQHGSGTTDYALGFALHTDTDRYFMIHAHTMYSLNGSADGYKTANMFGYEVSILLAALPINMNSPAPFLPYFGVKGMHAGKDKMNDEEMSNSGGDVAALTVGLQSLWSYIQTLGTFVMVDLSYHFPVLQRVNGVQMGFQSSFSMGIRVYIK